MNVLTVAPGNAAEGILGGAYTHSLTVEGGGSSFDWTVSSGALPHGLELVEPFEGSLRVTGRLHDAGPPSFTLRATNENADWGELELTISARRQRWLSYVADEFNTSRFDLYVVDISNGTPQNKTRVSNVGVDEDVELVKWSPDGRFLFYVVEKNLFVVNMQGPTPGTPTQVSAARPVAQTEPKDHVDGYVVSPHGNLVVMYGQDDMLRAAWYCTLDDSGSPGFPASLHSTEATNATSFVGSFNKDGSRFTLAVHQFTLGDYWVGRVNGGDIEGFTELVTGVSSFTYESANSWSAWTQSGAVSHADFTSLPPSVTEVEASLSSPFFALASTGALVYGHAGTEELLFLDKPGEGPAVPIASPVTHDAIQSLQQTAFSPDGRWVAAKVAAGANAARHPWHVIRVAPTIDSPRPAGPEAGHQQLDSLFVAFSPDSRYLLTQSDAAEDDTFRLHVVELESGTPTLPQTAAAAYLDRGGLIAWDLTITPDSRHIVMLADVVGARKVVVTPFADLATATEIADAPEPTFHSVLVAPGSDLAAVYGKDGSDKLQSLHLVSITDPASPILVSAANATEVRLPAFQPAP